MPLPLQSEIQNPDAYYNQNKHEITQGLSNKKLEIKDIKDRNELDYKKNDYAFTWVVCWNICLQKTGASVRAYLPFKPSVW